MNDQRIVQAHPPGHPLVGDAQGAGLAGFQPVQRHGRDARTPGDLLNAQAMFLTMLSQQRTDPASNGSHLFPQYGRVFHMGISPQPAAT